MSKPQDKFLPYGRQSIDEDDIAAVADVLRGDILTTGPKIAEFEKALMAPTGAPEVIAVGNGTHALHLACIAAGLEQGAWAIVPTLTFLATANAVRYCGADVIFADVDPMTGLMRPEDLQKAIDENKDKTIKAVLPVHLGGHPADMPTLRDIAKQHGMMVIADCCHALGGSQNNHAIGSGHYEDMAVFSFHPVKTIAMGEGGAITTADADIATRLRRLRSHGMLHTPDVGPWAYDMQELGYNYRVTDIQCALGISQLKKLDGFLARRRTLADLYDKSLAGIPHLRTPRRTPNAESGWHLYSVAIDFEALGKTRTEVMNALRAKNIGTQVHYIPVHSQPYYQNLYGAISLPGADRYYARTLSIPFYPAMDETETARVVDAIKEVLS